MISWREWLPSLWPPSAPTTAPEPRQWSFDPAPLPGSGDRLRDAVSNGERAKRLLDDDLLRWSLGEIRTRLREGMEQCPIADMEQMRVLRLWFEVVKAFEQNLKSLIDEGKMASQAIADIERQREFEKKYGKVNI